MNHSKGDPNKLTEAFRIIKLPVEQMKIRSKEDYLSPYR